MDQDTQLLSEMRDSLRTLPNELVLRMERARGGDTRAGKGPPDRAGSGQDEPEKPWYDDKSKAGSQIQAVENFGFALGRLIPEFGQLAQFSQSIRSIFDAWDKLGGKQADAGQQPAGAAELGKGRPSAEEASERRIYGDKLPDVIQDAVRPPSWAERFGERNTPMEAVPIGVEPPPAQTSAPDREKPEPDRITVERPEWTAPESPPTLPGVQRATEKEEGYGKRVEKMLEEQRKFSSPSSSEKPDLDREMRNFPWGAHQKMAQEMTGRPETGWAAQPPEAPGSVPTAAVGRGAPDSRGDGLFPDASDALKGDGGEGVTELAALLKAIEGKEDKVVGLLEELLRTAKEEQSDTDRDDTTHASKEAVGTYGKPAFSMDRGERAAPPRQRVTAPGGEKQKNEGGSFIDFVMQVALKGALGK